MLLKRKRKHFCTLLRLTFAPAVVMKRAAERAAADTQCTLVEEDEDNGTPKEEYEALCEKRVQRGPRRSRRGSRRNEGQHRL